MTTKREPSRKRPSSFELVELAPKACRCDVLEVLQKRFCSSFRVETQFNWNPFDQDVRTLHAEYEKTIREKNARYEQLSNDLRKAIDTGDLKIVSSEGIAIPVQEWILRVRVPKILNKKDRLQNTIKLGENVQVIRYWLTYVHTAGIDWYLNEEDGIKRLAQAFGPEGLLEVCQQQSAKWRRSLPGAKKESPPEKPSNFEDAPTTSADYNNDAAGMNQPLQISLDSFFDGSVLDRKSHEKSGQNQRETGKSCRKSIQIQPIQADGLIPDRQMNLNEEEEDVQFVEQKSPPKVDLDQTLVAVENEEREEGREDAIEEMNSKANLNASEEVETFTQSLLPQNLHHSFLADNDDPWSDQNAGGMQEEREVEEIDCEEILPMYQSTPKEKADKLNFPSNVKILKIGDKVTPMPDYDNMDQNKLNIELAKYGMRPKVPKKAKTTLKKIYEQLHPVIDPTTPTARPLRPLFADEEEEEKPKRVAKKKANEQAGGTDKPQKLGRKSSGSKNQDAGNPSADDGCNSGSGPIGQQEEKDSAESDDDLLEKDEDDEAEGDKTGLHLEAVIDDSGVLPKDLPGMQNAFTFWLKRVENQDLYLKVLDQSPIPLEVLLDRTANADSSVCGITKKAMPTLLDSLGITFALPQVAQGGPRVAAACRRRAKRK